nr:hypothetical protein BaRGS_028112 [Batillaria attramentaria]
MLLSLCRQAAQREEEAEKEDLLFTVNCTNRGLKNFPTDTPNSTQVLLLSHNRMRNLSSLPALPHLRLLDLSHNEIGFLDNHWVFEHMELLKELNLCGNSLKILQHGSFSGLKSLEVLRLCDNSIRTIELHAFGGLNHLSVLHLEHNDLYELKRPWLLAMTSLRELHIRDNHISVIEERTFDKHSSLLHLDISDNGLRKVAENGFLGLSKVRFVNMSENDFVSIPTQELQRLVNLEILLLDGIKVKSLRPGDFTDMSVSSLSLSFLPRLQVVENVRGVQPSDHGTYACKATSEIGYDISSTVVNVLNKELRLTVTDVANDYITVAWIGSIPITQMSNFQIFYRKSGDSDKEYDKVYLHGSMHKCRLAGLMPMTSYEICIVYREMYNVQCRNFSTDHKVALVHPAGGITRVNLAGIMASVCSVVGVLIVLCMVRAVMRRVRKRKDYKDPLCRDGGGEMDKISLEPINSQAPGTPLCSSRTALLPHSQI